MVCIKISKCGSEVLESFMELFRNKAEEFIEACLLPCFMLPRYILVILKPRSFLINSACKVRRHNVCKLVRCILIFDFVHSDGVKVERVDETR